MHFKLTQEMKQRIIVYSTSFIIAILFFTILNKFKDIKRAIQFILTILFPFLLGIGLAFILNNPQKWVEDRLLQNIPMHENHKRILSTALVFILTIGFLILFFSIIIPNTIDSVRQFSKNVAVYSDTLIGYTKDFAYKLNISEKQVEQMLINFDITKKITSVVTESIPKIASYSYGFVKGFINLILAFVSAFYILLDREKLVKGIKKLNYSLFDKNFANYLTLWTNDAKTVFEQYIVGNIIDSFIVGVICYFGALVLKLPYTSMIALIIGVTNVIPVFGPFLGAIPVIIILCLIDPFSALIFTIFIPPVIQNCNYKNGKHLNLMFPAQRLFIVPYVGIIQIRLPVEGHTFLSACHTSSRLYFIHTNYTRFPTKMQGCFLLFGHFQDCQHLIYLRFFRR